MQLSDWKPLSRNGHTTAMLPASPNTSGSWLHFSPLRTKEDPQEQNRCQRSIIREITASYPLVTRLYALIRFQIIPLRFLKEILQYLPEDGQILDLGCGFGLFALFMARCRPHAHVVALDRNPERIAIARRSAERLGIRNVEFRQQDLRYWHPDRDLAAAYALDVFHHLPVAAGNELLLEIERKLAPGGLFLLKDIDTVPRPMLWFTYLLDLVMSPRDSYCYRAAEVWRSQLHASGFTAVRVHYLWDILPYPHILIIGTKPR